MSTYIRKTVRHRLPEREHRQLISEWTARGAVTLNDTNCPKDNDYLILDEMAINTSDSPNPVMWLQHCNTCGQMYVTDPEVGIPPCQ